MVDGCRSKLANDMPGVLHGSVFGLLLFLLYPSDFFHTGELGCWLYLSL